LQSLSYAILEQIVATSVQGILLVETHGPNARIRYANRAYEGLCGYSIRELTGNSWNSHFAEDSVSTEQGDFRRLMVGGAGGSCRLACLRKDGSIWRSEVHLSRVSGTGSEMALLLAQHVVAGEDAEHAAIDDSGPINTGDLTSGNLSARRSSGPAAGMLSADQFVALLTRDLAIARRHDRTVTLMMFEISEFDVYRQTFGELAAEACARMVATQILGTFGRAIDLRARFDETSFVVAVHEQPEEQSRRLVRIVAEKTALLSLPNPRGRNRRVELAGTMVSAESANDDAIALIDRARAILRNEDTDSTSNLPPASQTG